MITGIGTPSSQSKIPRPIVFSSNRLCPVNELPHHAFRVQVQNCYSLSGDVLCSPYGRATRRQAQTFSIARRESSCETPKCLDQYFKQLEQNPKQSEQNRLKEARPSIRSPVKCSRLENTSRTRFRLSQASAAKPASDRANFGARRFA
jgi:hypothetical protein